MTEKPYDPKSRELAEKIYRDLVVGAVEVGASSVAMKTSPANLAAVSFKLAAAFQAAEDELNAANLPRNQDFKVGVDDLAAWTK